VPGRFGAPFVPFDIRTGIGRCESVPRFPTTGMTPRVEIIAHRGASRDRLENTLAAFSLALEQGADAFELDVHATRDGVVVVHHDPDVKLASTEDVGGRGSLMIRTVDYTTLQQHPLRNGETVPTLDDVLSLARGRATVYVEVKGFAIESLVADCLERHRETPTAVHSFDHRIPVRVADIRSSTPKGILSASYVLDAPHMIRQAGARDLWQQAMLIDRALVEAAHATGARVVAWTENNVAHAAELVQMGVDAICTDIPGAMREGLRNAGAL
jgi:glycerophosphoryl diester phosphodiesterase